MNITHRRRKELFSRLGAGVGAIVFVFHFSFAQVFVFPYVLLIVRLMLFGFVC